MPIESKEEERRQKAAIRMERNLSEMMNAADAEHQRSGMQLLSGAVVVLSGVIWQSGWELWVQSIAFVGLAGLIVGVRRFLKV